MITTPVSTEVPAASEVETNTKEDEINSEDQYLLDIDLDQISSDFQKSKEVDDFVELANTQSTQLYSQGFQSISPNKNSNI